MRRPLMMGIYKPPANVGGVTKTGDLTTPSADDASCPDHEYRACPFLHCCRFPHTSSRHMVRYTAPSSRPASAAWSDTSAFHWKLIQHAYHDTLGGEIPRADAEVWYVPVLRIALTRY